MLEWLLIGGFIIALCGALGTACPSRPDTPRVSNETRGTARHPFYD